MAIKKATHLSRDYQQLYPEQLKAFGIKKPRPLWNDGEPKVECEVSGESCYVSELTNRFYVPSKEEIAAKCEEFKAAHMEQTRRYSRRHDSDYGIKEIGGRHYATQKNQAGTFISFSPVE